MLKYTTTQVTFSEIPDQISLCINISNCPYHCPACHSKYLWRDIGEELTTEKLTQLIVDNQGITCVCFMGGDNDLETLYQLFNYIRTEHSGLKIAWYTGREDIPSDLTIVDYIKIGPYNEEFGPINKNTTNQRMYQRVMLNDGLSSSWYWHDITYKFWK